MTPPVSSLVVALVTLFILIIRQIEPVFPRVDHGESSLDDDRAVSETFAAALLIGLTIIGVTAILVFGGAAMEKNQHAIEVSQAENALSQFDTRSSRVAFGDADVQELDLGVGNGRGTLDVEPDSGWLRVRMINATTGATEAEIANETLGAVVYERDRTTIAYQGGGVWRSDRNGTTMVSRPEFHFRNETLTLPIITVDGSSVHSEVDITKAGPPDRKFPNAAANLTNTINNTKVSITVQSDYYTAWADYFREHTGGHVYVDHQAETATVVFLALPNTFHIRAGIIATAEAGTLELHGTGAYTDSYNSTIGPWSPPWDDGGVVDDGTVEAVGDVLLFGDSEIYGNIRSGGLVDLGSNSYVHHDVYWTDGCNTCDASHVGGAVTQIDGVATIEPIDGYVYNTVGALRSSNDNENTSLIDSNDRLTLAKGESGTLTAGEYYVERAEVLGGELVLDTTGGNITLAVEDWVLVEKDGGSGGMIRVKGDGDVRVFVASQDDAEPQITGGGAIPDDPLSNFHIGKKSRILVPGNVSTQFRVYGPRTFRGTITGDNSPPENSFNGLIYAPAGLNGDSYVYTKQSDVYGGIVAGTVIIGQNGKVHYDEALSDIPLPRSPTVSRIEYMHVTIHAVNVTAS